MRRPPSPSMTAACQVSARTPRNSLSGIPRLLGLLGLRPGPEPPVEAAHHQHEEAQREEDDAHASQDEPGGVEHRGSRGYPSMTASGSPASTLWPGAMGSALTVPLTGATIGSSILSASSMQMRSPSAMGFPTSANTLRIFPGAGASTICSATAARYHGHAGESNQPPARPRPRRNALPLRRVRRLLVSFHIPGPASRAADNSRCGLRRAGR